MKCTHWLAGWSPAPAYYGEVSFGHKHPVSQASCIMILYLSWTRNQQSRGLCINTSEAVTPSKPSLKSFSEAVWSQLLRSDVKPLLWVLTARCLGTAGICAVCLFLRPLFTEACCLLRNHAVLPVFCWLTFCSVYGGVATPVTILSAFHGYRKSFSPVGRLTFNPGFGLGKSLICALLHTWSLWPSNIVPTAVIWACESPWDLVSCGL